MANERSAKACSCDKKGVPDGWVVQHAFSAEVDPTGSTRLCLTTPPDRLLELHLALINGLAEPLSVLYRRKINRQDPRPEGDPGQDFVALELPKQRVIDAVKAASLLLHHDARCEIWIRGGMQEQVILDQDGTLYCYPDDPMFRDAATMMGLEESDEHITLEERDYVRHSFLAAADAPEVALIAELALAGVPVQKG